MATPLDRLRRLIPPPAGDGHHRDWAAVEERLGLPLPQDYKDLVDLYGGGQFSDHVGLLVQPPTRIGSELVTYNDGHMGDLDNLWSILDDRPAELAADGISEWLDRLADQQALGQPPSLPAGANLALRATDQDLTENTWTVIGSAGGVHWHGQPASADLALSGPATDLLLALLRRQPAEETGISMQGDTALWHSWLALTPL